MDTTALKELKARLDAAKKAVAAAQKTLDEVNAEIKKAKALTKRAK
jgi:multidrug resistance efflux pump